MTKLSGVIHVVTSEHFVAYSHVDQQRYCAHAGQAAYYSHQYLVDFVFVHPFYDTRSDVRENTSADEGQAQVETDVLA